MLDHIAQSFHVERDDLDVSRFDAPSGRGRIWQLFGEGTDRLPGELNAALVA